MKNVITILIVLVLIGVGAYFLFDNAAINNNDEQPATSTSPVATTTEPTAETDDSETVIGRSVDDREIKAYHYGEGDVELLFVGGIHGGYEWNTSAVAFELMDFFETNADEIPDNVRVTVIPVLNPDGLSKVATIGDDGRFDPASITKTVNETIPGRFNANNVDLNRNFDCDWQAQGTWQSRTVSGGSAAFSEPESQAVRDYVSANKPTAVVAWYSSAGGVYASSCHNGVSSETTALTNAFAKASGYPAHQEFDFYEITGDMVNWFAKQNIPAISVLLTTHTDVEWSKNLAGVKAVLEYYRN